MKRNAPLILIFLAFALATQAADIGFSGDVTMVSTYVWRGVTQFHGAAMQGTAEVSSGVLSVGLWSSSWHGEFAVETDPYIGLSLPTGQVETSLGATLYGYDFFTGPGSIYEVYASAGYGPASLAFYYTPEQQDGDQPDVYWLELAGAASWIGADWSAGLGYGTYSNWNFDGDAPDAVMTLLLSATKSVTDDLAVSWNYALPLSDDQDLSNVFFFTLGYGF
ncbi:hypothetical protein JXA02_08820 [candidate division KSB1 bacterium]|nr:hypothetical protein [candidate division KSB1 bacterium]RQW04977.1 MAG: hypothetical protein EH222_10410 [candidate division KSB1 bacterium]